MGRKGSPHPSGVQENCQEVSAPKGAACAGGETGGWSRARVWAGPSCHVNRAVAGPKGLPAAVGGGGGLRDEWNH